MNSHKNARLTYQGRRILVSRMIREGLPVEEAAKAQELPTRGSSATGRKGKRAFWTEASGQDEAQDAPLGRLGVQSHHVVHTKPQP